MSESSPSQSSCFKNKKVAIVGNQNGNGFSMMRYFRNLGIDAHLLPFANDGKGEMGHFSPEEATPDSEAWQPYVHATSINDYFLSALPFWLGIIFLPLLRLASFFGLISAPPRGVSRRKLQRELDGYDIYIGSGVAPALFFRSGIKLTAYFPYSTGVEYVRGVPLLPFFSKPIQYFFAAAFFLPSRRMQVRGIRATDHVIISGDRFAQDVLGEIGVAPKTMYIPNTFVSASQKNANPTWQELPKMKAWAMEFDTVFFTSVRQYWQVKRNDFFLESFAEACAGLPLRSAGLVMVDYGPDVGKAKSLISSLGLENRILWLSKVGLSEVASLIRECDVFVGQFDNGPTIWGNAGWEALACGKAILQGFEWSPGEFEKVMGLPEPPILGVKNRIDIVRHVRSVIKQPELATKMGSLSAEWFNCFCGVSGARAILNTICDRSAPCPLTPH